MGKLFLTSFELKAEEQIRTVQRLVIVTDKEVQRLQERSNAWAVINESKTPENISDIDVAYQKANIWIRNYLGQTNDIEVTSIEVYPTIDCSMEELIGAWRN